MFQRALEREYRLEAGLDQIPAEYMEACRVEAAETVAEFKRLVEEQVREQQKHDPGAVSELVGQGDGFIRVTTVMEGLKGVRKEGATTGVSFSITRWEDARRMFKVMVGLQPIVTLWIGSAKDPIYKGMMKGPVREAAKKLYQRRSKNVKKFLDLMLKLADATERWNETHDEEGGDAGYEALIDQLLDEARTELLDDDGTGVPDADGEEELAEAPRTDDAADQGPDADVVGAIGDGDVQTVDVTPEMTEEIERRLAEADAVTEQEQIDVATVMAMTALGPEVPAIQPDELEDPDVESLRALVERRLDSLGTPYGADYNRKVGGMNRFLDVVHDIQMELQRVKPDAAADACGYWTEMANALGDLKTTCPHGAAAGLRKMRYLVAKEHRYNVPLAAASVTNPFKQEASNSGVFWPPLGYTQQYVIGPMLDAADRRSALSTPAAANPEPEAFDALPEHLRNNPARGLAWLKVHGPAARPIQSQVKSVRVQLDEYLAKREAGEFPLIYAQRTRDFWDWAAPEFGWQELKELFEPIYSRPIVSDGCERGFSDLKLNVGDRRRRLAVEMVMAEMILRHRGQERFDRKFGSGVFKTCPTERDERIARMSAELADAALRGPSLVRIDSKKPKRPQFDAARIEATHRLASASMSCGNCCKSVSRNPAMWPCRCRRLKARRPPARVRPQRAPSVTQVRGGAGGGVGAGCAVAVERASDESDADGGPWRSMVQQGRRKSVLRGADCTLEASRVDSHGLLCGWLTPAARLMLD
jgi:hypothetical protein